MPCFSSMAGPSCMQRAQTTHLPKTQCTPTWVKGSEQGDNQSHTPLCVDAGYSVLQLHTADPSWPSLPGNDGVVLQG